MSNITMCSPILEIIEITKPTNAELFKNLKIGSRIVLSVDIEYAGRNNSTYATYIKITNLNDKQVCYKSFNQLPRILRNFKFKEV